VAECGLTIRSSGQPPEYRICRLLQTLGHTLEPLVFEYRLDWRLHLSLARARGGFLEIKKRARRMRCNQLVWMGLFLVGAVAGWWLRSVAMVGVGAALMIWMIVYAYKVRHIGRSSVLKMRKYLRQSGTRRIQLTVTNEGFAEVEDGNSSIAPWEQVHSYFCSAEVLAIEVEPGQWSVIPMGLPNVKRLVAELSRRAIPQALPQAWRAKGAA
jgi:hypothetical protein